MKVHKGKDKLSTAARSENMRRIRSTNTNPELQLRSLLHRAGYRFRVNVRRLPGKPDIVFASKKKIIFVHGCFWHLHEDANCVEARIPSSRQEYWIPKLNRNRERDKTHEMALIEAGWRILTIWECEFKEMESMLRRAIAFLETR